MLHCETNRKRVKTVTSWSILRGISVIVLHFLLYFMLHIGCVTCHFVLTLIECNLEILCWFLDLCIVLCIETTKEHVIKTGSVSIIKWQVEETSAELGLGLTEGAVRYWFSDWGSSVVCQTQTCTPPHPFTQGYELFQCLKCFVFWIWDGRQVQGPAAGTLRFMQCLLQKMILVKTDMPVNVSFPLFPPMLL